VAVERRYELDRKVRSLAMLPPGHPAALLDEAALELVEELANVHERLRRLSLLLRAALEEPEGEAGL
jgi:hypothetical protein